MARITTAIRERVESILSSGVETVDADSVSIGQAAIGGTQITPKVEQPRPAADNGYAEVGEEQLTHTLQTSGSRILGPVFNPIDSATTITSTSFTRVMPPTVLGGLESPPGMVPVLHAYFDVVSQDSGETFTVRVENPAGDFYLGFETGTGTSPFRGWDEVYLDQETNGTARQKNAYEGYGFQMSAKVSGGSTGGEIRPATTFRIEYEVI